MLLKIKYVCFMFKNKNEKFKLRERHQEPFLNLINKIVEKIVCLKDLLEGPTVK